MASHKKSMKGLIKQLVRIERECRKNKPLNDELESYCTAVGEPTTYNDAIAFIKEYEKVKASIKNTG